jgi:hypothetical protein
MKCPECGSETSTFCIWMSEAGNALVDVCRNKKCTWCKKVDDYKLILSIMEYDTLDEKEKAFVKVILDSKVKEPVDG